MSSGDDDDVGGGDRMVVMMKTFPLLTWCHQETQPPVSACSEESRQRRTHDQVKEYKTRV